MPEEFDFKGLLKPEEEKDFGKSLDEMLPFKEIFKSHKFIGLAIETVDGRFFTISIRVLDDEFADRIPDDYKPLAREVLLAIIDKDWDVDLTDFAILADQWQQIPSEPSADIAPSSGDGFVDINDLCFLVDNWLWGTI